MNQKDNENGELEKLKQAAEAGDVDAIATIALKLREWDHRPSFVFEGSWIYRAVLMGDRDLVGFVLRDTAQFVSASAPTRGALMALILPGLQRYVAGAGADDSEAHLEIARVLETQPHGTQEAEWHYRVAAELGQPAAMKHIGRNFAVLLQAAEDGDIRAAAEVAHYYAKGYGCRRSMPQAIKWYSVAAKGGDLNVAMKLCALYSGGEGVRPDLREKLLWLHFAAKAGHPEAISQLESAAKSGNIVAVDLYRDVLGLATAPDSPDASKAPSLHKELSDDPNALCEASLVALIPLIEAYELLFSIRNFQTSEGQSRLLDDALIKQRRGILLLLQIPLENAEGAVALLNGGRPEKVEALLKLASISRL